MITNRNATRLEFEKILVSEIWSKIGISVVKSLFQDIGIIGLHQTTDLNNVLNEKADNKCRMSNYPIWIKNWEQYINNNENRKVLRFHQYFRMAENVFNFEISLPGQRQELHAYAQRS